MAITSLIPITDFFNNIIFNVVRTSYQAVDMRNVVNNTIIYSSMIGHLQNARFGKEGESKHEVQRISSWTLTVTTENDILIGDWIIVTSMKTAPMNTFIPTAGTSAAPQHQYKVDFIHQSFANTNEKILSLSRRDQVASTVNTADGMP